MAEENAPIDEAAAALGYTAEEFSELTGQEQTPETPETPEATETPEDPLLPKVETSESKPVEETPPAPESFNWEEKTGGKFKSQQEFDEAVALADSLRSKEKALSEYDPSSVFANEDIKRLNSFAKSTGLTDPFVFNKLSSIKDINDLSPEETLALAQFIQTPGLTSSDYDKLIAKKQREYGINEEKWLEDDENYKAPKDSIDLKTDTVGAKKLISETLEKFNTANEIPGFQDRVASLEANKKSWVQAGEVIGSKDITVSTKDGDGKFDVQLPAKELAAAAKAISGLFAESGQEFNDQNKNTLGQLTTLLALGIKASNGSFAENYRGKMYAEVKKEVDSKYHNPEPIDSDKTPPPSGSRTEYDKNFEDALSRAGL